MKRTMKLGTVAIVMMLALGHRSGEALEVANPTVSAAVSGGNHGQPFGGFAAADVPAGYLEEERFISGTAASFTKAGEWGVDGRWALAPSNAAPFKVRMLVRRPKDASRFNGIVVVEWLNVTAQLEGAADYMQMQE